MNIFDYAGYVGILVFDYVGIVVSDYVGIVVFDYVGGYSSF